ncbi:MAG: polymer-forming cytoskeletal protein [Patescibacteria group bacterium]|jgi:hypothetical protein
MKKTLIVAGLLLFVFALPASAATFGSGEMYSLNSGKPLVGNFYGVGASLNINDEIQGDAYLAGANLTVSSLVQDDLNVAGANVLLNGQVNGDLRAVGSNVYINKNIGGEVMTAGGYVVLADGAEIAGNFYSAAGKMVLLGDIKGDAELGAGEIEIHGTIDGNLKVIADSLILASTAVVNGNLDCTGPNEPQITAGAAVKGETNYIKKDLGNGHKKVDGKAALSALFGVVWFLKLIGTLILGLLLYFVFKKKIKEVAQYSSQKFGLDLLRGLVVMIVLPIVAVILMITIVGLPLGILAMLLYAILCILAAPVAGMILGALIFRLFTKNYRVDHWSVVIGIILLSVLMLVPIVGWVICAVFFLVGMGTISLHLYRHGHKLVD